MARFCNQCGSPLTPKNSECPVCNKGANKKYFDLKRFFKRLLLKTSLFLLVLTILTSSTCISFVHFEIANIPVIAQDMEKFGYSKDREIESDDDSIKTEIECDENNVLKDEIIQNSTELIDTLNTYSKELQFENALSDLEVVSERTIDNARYYRLQQRFKGVPVYGQQFTVATDNDGKVLFQSIEAVDIESNFDVIPSVSIDNVNANIKKFLTDNAIDEEEYEKYIENENSQVLITIYPKSDDFTLTELNNDNLYIYFHENIPLLVYFVSSNGDDKTESFSQFNFVIDANTGEVLATLNNFDQSTVTCYNADGTKSFMGYYDETKNSYYLKDDERNIGIWTYDGKNSATSEPRHMQSSDPYFGNEGGKFDESRYDIGLIFYENVVDIYDFFYESFEDSGYDFLAACYDDGRDNGNNGLASGDDEENIGNIFLGTNTSGDFKTVAHEYTHLITKHIVNWAGKPKNEKNETGAINEAYSDIFAIIADAVVRNNGIPDWTYSDRNIADPMSEGYPAKLSDKEFKYNPIMHFGDWINSNEQKGTYVPLKDGLIEDYSHGFSTVVSHAAYLMNTGLDGQYVALDLNTLASLWYETLYLLPSDCSFVVLRAYMEAVATKQGLTQGQKDCICAAFDAVEITRDTIRDKEIVLVLDTSGSMDGEPTEEMKNACRNFISTTLDLNTYISIVTYADEASTICSSSYNQTSLINAVDSINANGETNIDSGLQNAYSLLKESKAKEKIIVLMSDGQPTCGRTGNELITFADEIKANNIYIYTSGFFSKLEDNKTECQALMESLASIGNHYEIDDISSLSPFFGDIADQISGQQYIYARIACPVDIEVTFNGETLSSNKDSESTRTSFGTLTFEDNQMSSNTSVDDRIKVLRLKADDNYEIKIHGIDSGKMNFTVSYMDETGTYSDSRVINNIPVTRNSEFVTSTAKEKNTVVHADTDGNGIYDINYTVEKDKDAKQYNNNLVYYIAVAWSVVVLSIYILIKSVKYKKKRSA
ncbi:MAG: VWA domain-containing protein [Faecalibacterium sp.]|nr:VWA domain-containing protein [Ruminococcus sp.]MCM1391526.1 VWA domain-containing protein [Ruminococcus sp.]MCM1485514.1 VWA domain-containing protein [Faecalibacterium sp.]